MGVVGSVPVEANTAEDHEEENGEVNPVHPSDGEGMFAFQANGRG